MTPAELSTAVGSVQFVTPTCPTCGSLDVRRLLATTPARPEVHAVLRCWTCDGGWEMDGRVLIDEFEIQQIQFAIE